MTLQVTPWRLVVDAAAGTLARELLAELGPTRGTTAAIATGPALVYALIESPSPDRWGTAWVATVELAALWAAGVFHGEPVDLEVEVDGLRVATPAETMATVADGGDYAAWRAAVSSNRQLRAI